MSFSFRQSSVPAYSCRRERAPKEFSPGAISALAQPRWPATPVRGVNWDHGPAFGTAVSRFAYTTPLTVRMSFGARF
jgi:hypothetical protein